MNRWIVLVAALLLCVTTVQVWSAPQAADNNDTDVQDDDPNDGTQDDVDTSQANSEPPEFISKPGYFSHMVNETVYLPCLTKNTDDVAVIWYRGPELLSYQLGPRQEIMKENNTLVIRNLELSDSSDNYTCTILYDDNKKLNLVHKLYVTPQVDDDDKILITPSKYNDINEGESLNLACEVRGRKVKEISWNFRGQRKVSVKDASVAYLPITDATWHMAGDYQCMVEEHDNPKPTISHAKLKVKHRPAITTEKDELHHHLHNGRKDYFTGENVETNISCVIHSHPPLRRLEWHKDGQPIYIDGSHYSKHNLTDHTHVLTIHKTTKDDLGEYKCKAFNDIGETWGPILNLRDTPARPVWLSGKVVDSNSIQFLWQVISYKSISGVELKYRKKDNGDWMYAEKWDVVSSIGKQHMIQTIITGLEPDNTYECLLRAKNDDVKDGGYVQWGPESPLKFFNTSLEKAESVKDSGMRSEISFLTLLLVFVPLMHITCL